MTRDGMVVLMTLFMAVASVMLMWGVPLRPTCRLQAAKVLFTRRVPFDPDRHVLDAKLLSKHLMMRFRPALRGTWLFATL